MSTNDKYRAALKSQIVEAHGSVFHTQIAHYKIAERLTAKQKRIRKWQIVLTSISTAGFLAIVITNQYCLSWIGGIISAIALALTLYTYDFRMPDEIAAHKAAADNLWLIRESFISLLTDFPTLKDQEIRAQRDTLLKQANDVYKKHPITDKKGYSEGQASLKHKGDYTFQPGEAEALLPENLRDNNYI